MFLFIYKTLKMVLAAIRGSNSPGQVGFGIALGMMIGIMPKDSLITYCFGLLIFATNVNLLATSLSAFCFMWLGALLDPVSHQVGHYVLTQSSLQSTFLWLYEQPIIPWTRFNNTIVMGCLLIGTISFFPVYLIGKTIFQKYAPAFNQYMIRYWFYRMLAGQKKVSELVGAEE